MDQDQFGRDLAERLRTAEQAVDVAVAAVCDLGADMARGRIRHGISAVVGQEALGDVMAALPLIARSRDRLVRAHRRLARDDRGVRQVDADPKRRKRQQDGHDKRRASRLFCFVIGGKSCHPQGIVRPVSLRCSGC